jgi:hypothetical protein
VTDTQKKETSKTDQTVGVLEFIRGGSIDLGFDLPPVNSSSPNSTTIIGTHQPVALSEN